MTDQLVKETALIVRWLHNNPTERGAILVMAQMEPVEAPYRKSDRCHCGMQVYVYAEDGSPLCETHGGE